MSIPICPFLVITMFVKKVTAALFMSLFLISSVQAQATSNIKDYFSETAAQVKAESDPIQKRIMLKGALERMTVALDKVEGSIFVSEEDLASLDGFRNALQEKQDELAGTNGFNPVPNSQLNSFADYVVQDMEQADRSITISVVTALLILIIVLLVA